jgi:restriction system protein
MAIPTYQDFMRPLLVAIQDGREYRLRDLFVPLGKSFGLTDDQMAEKLPSGTQRVVNNRVSWARTYLGKAGLICSPKRGFIAITELGKSVLRENPPEINYKFLERFESFKQFRELRHESAESLDAPEFVASEATPEEAIESAYEQMQQKLSDDLLEKVKECSPYFFEKVVLQLLLAMGYGGVGGRGTVTPPTRDGGIDGIIYEDKLGLDIVCIQAKRWENTVSRPRVQEFVGSMDLHRSKKGVMLTTSEFSGDARDFVDRIEGKKVVLIDGDKLSELMIEHRVGVTPKRNFELLDISQDFFDEDE